MLLGQVFGRSESMEKLAKILIVVCILFVIVGIYYLFTI